MGLKNLFLSTYSFLVARRSLYKLNKVIYLMSLKGIGTLNCENMKVSGEDYFLRKFLREYPNAVVFDVGANVGKYSKLVKSYAPESQVYAFEPHPKTFQKLNELSEIKKFKTFQLGLGKKPGQLTLYDSMNYDGSEHASFHKTIYEEVYKTDYVEHQVEIVTVDQFFAEQKIEQLDLLKIDAEGFVCTPLEHHSGRIPLFI